MTKLDHFVTVKPRSKYYVPLTPILNQNLIEQGLWMRDPSNQSLIELIWPSMIFYDLLWLTMTYYQAPV